MYICEVLRERVGCDEVSNECWSSEIGGASRRSHMGPPFGRPHKSYFLVIKKWATYWYMSVTEASIYAKYVGAKIGCDSLKYTIKSKHWEKFRNVWKVFYTKNMCSIKNQCWMWWSVLYKVVSERDECGEVSNEYGSSEMGGAKRRSHMGPPFGRPHKSYFLDIKKWVTYQ
jgi:hypothetical protein